jgi:hypothetical protein
MNLRERLHRRPTLLRLAMLCLILFSILGYAARGATGWREDAVDGARGLLLGMEIALVFWYFRLPGIQRCGEG